AELRRRLRVASRVRVITHPRGRLRAAGSPGPALGDPGPVVGRRPLPGRGEQANAERDANPVPAQLPVQLIVIGASTGGPQALATLLGELPGDLGPAILVVQHMAEGFIEGLAGWLDGLCALPVAVGENGRRLRPGTVTIAPSGLNLIVHQHLRVTTEPPPPTQYHVPGIDATFLSVARHVGSEVVAVLLTGMGRDGAVGLRALHDHGARTVAQDEATSAVYGMPAAAVALGAADAVLPLGEIGGYLLATVGVSEPVAEAGP
ncbi:MAG TPA: CheB methylesterase domain-containing protein, partial [Mycobacteriales bacterium]|nr:CheB methylesterase domain-containing protein [Mycobacteriales bacterium]